MLLKSEAELKTYAKITLLFDDDTSTEQVVCTGTKLKVTYRHDNSKVTKVGIVKSIERIVYRDDAIHYNSCMLHHIREPRPEEPNIPRAFDRTCCTGDHTSDCAEYWFEPAKPRFVINMDCSENFNSSMVRVSDTDIIELELMVSDDKTELLTEYNKAKTIDNSNEQYTKDSYEYLSNIMKISKVVLDDPTLEASVCSTLYRILSDAILSLVPNIIPEPELPEDETPSENPSTENEDGQNTPSEDTNINEEGDQTPSTDEVEGTPTETTPEENPTDPTPSTEGESGTPSMEETPSVTPTEEENTPVENPVTDNGENNGTDPQEEVNVNGDNNNEEAAGGSGESGV